MTSETLDIAGLAIGVVLTLMILSYLLGDNPLYRLAMHIFVGALVGYSLGVVIQNVIIDQVWKQLPTNPVTVIPLALGLLLLFKFFPKQAFIGNFSVAYLAGVGTAVALGGALLGTLGPQILATGQAFSSSSRASLRLGTVDSLLILVGTICTLMSFTFTAQKQYGLAGLWSRIVKVVGTVGRVFLIFAFAVAFAGALTASLSIFIGRIQYLIQACINIYNIYSNLPGG